MAYRFVEHTGDVAAELSGRSLEALFNAALQALTDTVTDRGLVRAVDSAPVSLDAPSLDDLLVDWLNELVFRLDAGGFAPADATLVVRQTAAGWHLEGTVRGEPLDPSRHPSRVIVKGATYHGLHVTETDGAWRARVVFDI